MITIKVFDNNHEINISNLSETGREMVIGALQEIIDELWRMK